MCPGTPRAVKRKGKFHLRLMKSLRKTITLACSLILASPSAILEARSPREQDAPSSAQQQATTLPQSDAQAKIIKNVNYVVLPVTAKDAAARLVLDLRMVDFPVLAANV